ncbi:MAG: hypothetical protein HXY27_04650 [Hydrogenophilaceae bacterium]|nr:hypothetical protein [Hydrogenophilaceae bacterium]
MNQTKPRLQILPGSAPGKIRVRGEKSEAEYWLPRINADKAKIRSVTLAANELIESILKVADYYECPPDEVSLMLNLAARDPVNALACFRDIAHRLVHLERNQPCRK